MVDLTILQGKLSLLGREKREVRTQFAALCFRVRRERSEVLLVTSRDTGRWVLPKGWPINGLTPAESAAREAWEEAGVRGRTLPQCLGFYSYGKRMPDNSLLPCAVAVFALEVSEICDTFPEEGERKRKWFPPRKAATRVDEPELARILEEFAERGPGRQ